MLIHPHTFHSLSAGKSALHWAAAVNNVEAAVVLLKNGANKDMQDNKVCEMIPLSWSYVAIIYTLTFSVVCLVYSLCVCYIFCRKRHLCSLQPVKAAMRQPRFCWSTLPTVRSLTI